MIKILLLINICSTLFMCGIIWLVHIVNYPLFSKVISSFEQYHRSHVQRTTYVVAVPMILEAMTSVMMLWYPHPNIHEAFLWVGIGLIFVIWLTTLFFSVPAHDHLMKGFDMKVHRSLLQSNRIRTAAWSLRGFLAGYYMNLILL